MGRTFAAINEHQSARLFAGVALCAVWMVYASVVGLAFLHDDAPVIASIYSKTIFDVFVPVGTHYRPSSYVLWLMVRDAFGYFDSVPIYWISLALHALNVALVMRLSAALRLRRFAAPETPDVWAGLLFGLFPLSYQVLTWSSAMVHPALCAYTLIAVLLAVRLSTHKHGSVARSLLILGMIGACALACASHQLGIIAPVLVGLTAALISRAPWPRRMAMLAAGSAAGLAYGLWLRSFPGIAPATPISLSVVQHLLQSDALPLLAQAVAYPALPVLLGLGYAEPVIETQAALLMTAIGAGALTFLLALFTGRLRVWVFALAWIALTALPLLLVLPDSYVRLGPRLFYTTAVGIGLAWSLGMSAGGRMARATSGAVALLVCAWSVAFVGERVAIASQVSRAIKSVSADMRQAPDNQRTLIVNHPIWAAAASVLPMGSSAVLVFADEYSPPWQLYWANAQVQRDVRLLRPSDTPGLSISTDNTRYELTGERLDATERKALLTPPVAVYEYAADAAGVNMRSYGRLTLESATAAADAQLSEPALARFDLEPGAASLISAHAFACGQQIRLDLQWARAAGIVNALGVSAHVHAGSDDVVAAADGDLLGNTLPLNELKPGERASESRYLANPRVDSDAPKSIRLGVYYKSTGQPKRAWRADGAEWERNEVVIPVEAGGAQCR